MAHPIKRSLAILAATLIPGPLFAGTLDGAPFSIAVPSADWAVQDTTAQPMGDGVALVASILNAKDRVKSVVVKTDLEKKSDNALDDLCAGVMDSFSNPNVKVISQADTTFLGYKARKFEYQITQGPHLIYNEAIVFVTEATGWTIACVGPIAQQKEIDQAFGFYQKR